MKILFTDGQEYDNKNTSENIKFCIIGKHTYTKFLEEIIYNKDIDFIKILDKDTKKTKVIYPVSQIMRIIL